MYLGVAMVGLPELSTVALRDELAGRNLRLRVWVFEIVPHHRVVERMVAMVGACVLGWGALLQV